MLPISAVKVLLSSVVSSVVILFVGTFAATFMTCIVVGLLLCHVRNPTFLQNMYKFHHRGCAALVPKEAHHQDFPPRLTDLSSHDRFLRKGFLVNELGATSVLW